MKKGSQQWLPFLSWYETHCNPCRRSAMMWGMKTLAQFRFVIAVMCGIGCFTAAALRFHLPTLSLQVFASLFGVAWLAQAYRLEKQIH